MVLREKGVSAATLDDVMARTRASKSQLFHYFPAGKDELLLAVEQRAAALLAGIQGGVSILQSTGRADHLRAALDQGIGDLRHAAA